MARAKRWKIQHLWHNSVNEGDLTVGLRSKSKYFRLSAEFYCDDNSFESVGMAAQWTFWNFCLKINRLPIVLHYLSRLHARKSKSQFFIDSRATKKRFIAQTRAVFASIYIERFDESYY